MSVRLTRKDDLIRVMEIYRDARERMKESNNPTQWPYLYPYKYLIEDDIKNKRSYVIERDEKIVGVFALFFDEDKTYINILGKWLNDESYVTIHRIAGDRNSKGIFEEAFNFVKGLSKNIRCDTHEKNQAMRHVMTKLGFKECGIIEVETRKDRKRVAYHYAS